MTGFPSLIARLVLAISCLLLIAPATATEAPTSNLTLVGPGQVRNYSQPQLLRDPALVSLSLSMDPAYRRPMTYRAIPLAPLLQAVGIAPEDTLQFVASDGFAADIPAQLLLAPKGSIAYLAIENPAAPWPPLPSHGVNSAGPFYLVWQHPEQSQIRPEQWPFQIATIRRVPRAGERYPNLVPSPELPPDSAERRGFNAFVTNCMPCHKLNAQGDGTLGPDLNLPHNPTEYMGESYLRLLIRDPQQLRRWPAAKMPGVPVGTMPEAELNDLLAYLRHMAGRKLK